MEEHSVFRKKSLDRMRSPEQLNDYLRVTNPGVWLILSAVAVLLAGLLIWSAFVSIESSIEGSGQVTQGVMTIRLTEDSRADSVEAGMTVRVGDRACTVSNLGQDGEGRPFALAETDLPDGTYQVRVVLNQTQALKLLLN